MMNLQQIVNSFRLHDINLHPAGIWEFDHTGKKVPVIAYRADGLPLDNYPHDNMLKMRIETTPYMVIDLDAPDAQVLSEVYRRFPSLSRSLTTTTTREDKLHIYIKRPAEFPLTRIVGALGKDSRVDILSNGIVFEGHLYDINEHYDIENPETIVSLTAKEIDELMALVPSGQLKSNGLKITNKRFNPGEYKILKEYISDALQDERLLWKMLTPKGTNKVGKAEFKAPELRYDTFNTMAYYLALNEYIPHDMVISFLEKLLVKEYKIDLNSRETTNRFYKQIVPTLPVYEVEDKTDSFDIHIANAPISRCGNFQLVTTVDSSGGQKFVLIDKYSSVPQEINGTILRAQKSIQFLFPTLDSDTYTYGVPMIELTSNPYKPHKAYDFDRKVFTLNTLKPSQYLLECAEIDSKPDNILTKAISNIFKVTEDAQCQVDPEDFYYHWLSHILFSQKQMSTIFSLSTDATVQGGTGKSTFTAKLPMHILPRGTVFTVDEGTAAWGDAFYNSKLTCFDDLHDTDKWSKLYTTMKRETSGTISKKNIKGGATTISETSACLAISSNFLPKIDETDRRFFIWAPTEKLSEDEGLQIAKLMSDFNAYRPEIQEITSYCLYLYNNYRDKYEKELYIEAPKTTFSRMAKTEGTTSKKLLSLILNGPDSLFDSFVPNKKLKLSKREIVEIILKQISEPTSKSSKYMLHLPQDLGTVLLNATRDEDMSNESPRNIALLLGCTFATMTKTMYAYREYPQCKGWVTRGIRLPIEEEVIAKYKQWLKYNIISEASDVEIVKNVEI